MPHLIIEYARCLVADDKIPRLLDVVHDAAASTDLFEESHIKTRAIPVDFYRTGSGYDPFIHVCLKIKCGRNDVQKTSLSETVLSAIRGLNLPVKVVTVEVVDMDSNSYARFIATAPVF